MITQTIEVKKAWLGKWLAFNSAHDGRSDRVYIKKIATTWKFWDTTVTPNAWTNLPRPISNYTINNMVFVQSGSHFVSRDNSSFRWPEAFAQPANYNTKLNNWLNNINSVWHDKFTLKRKTCNTANCCEWKIKVKAAWSNTPADKTIYAIWAQEWERSNAKDWYLTENRVSVAAHEAGHLLGAYDEYTGGAVDPVTPQIDANSIMGNNLSIAKARHFNNLRDNVKIKINTWISKNWDFEIQ